MKDPNNPIIKKYFVKSEDKFLDSITVIKKPIRKDPNMLTKRVPRNI